MKLVKKIVKRKLRRYKNKIVYATGTAVLLAYFFNYLKDVFA